jgi:ornithine cyclodeaminase/alanine dehydrogenase
MVLALSRQDVATALSMKVAIAAMEQAFQEMGEGTIDMPLRQTLNIKKNQGITSVMPAYLDKMGALGLKLVSSYPGNPARFGLPTVQATILYCDSQTGQLIAIMEAGFITAVRTGAASGVATKLLARPDSRIVGIIGSGVQAETQLEAMCAVRNIAQANVFSPTLTHRTSFADRMSERLGIDVSAVENPKAAVERCDIVITSSSAKTPVLNGDWLSPGTHINAIGSHSPDARELDTRAIQRSKVVVDSMEAALREAGDLMMPLAEGVIERSHVYAELGELVLGQKTGRVDPEEITLFKSQGLAIEDVSAAKLVYEVAKERKLGVEISL